MSGRSWIEGYTRSRHQITISFGIDDLRFSTSYWYEDVDLSMLEQQYGSAFMEKVYFHIIAFEINKLARCSVWKRTRRLNASGRYPKRAWHSSYATAKG